MRSHLGAVHDSHKMRQSQPAGQQWELTSVIIMYTRSMPPSRSKWCPARTITSHHRPSLHCAAGPSHIPSRKHHHTSSWFFLQERSHSSSDTQQDIKPKKILIHPSVKHSDPHIHVMPSQDLQWPYCPARLSIGQPRKRGHSLPTVLQQ